MSSLPSTVTVYPHQLAHTRSESLFDKLAFLCFAGFIASLAYPIAIVSLPVNWAVWPTLFDSFGFGMLIFVALSSNRKRLSEFDKTVLKSLGILFLFTLLSFFLQTLFRSKTGVAIKYGGYTLILLIKYLLVYWAAAYIPLDEKRLSTLHWISLLVFIWLAAIGYAVFLGILPSDRFISHLPAESAGYYSRWKEPTLMFRSVQGSMLVAASLFLLTANKRRTPFITLIIMIVAGFPIVLLSGGRQALIRFAVFFIIFLGKNIRKGFSVFFIIAIIGLVAIETFKSEEEIFSNPIMSRAISRHSYLLRDPFSNEGMAGRPSLWKKTIDYLNEDPLRYIWGGGIGSYAEERTASHNMFLQLLSEGGIILLLVYIIFYLRLWKGLWRFRNQGWAMVALTGAYLSSAFSSEIFYVSLGSGWGLGLYFVCLHIAANLPNPSNRK